MNTRTGSFTRCLAAFVFASLGVLSVGCGDDDTIAPMPDSGGARDATTADGGASDDGGAPVDAPAAALVLTSSAFEEGARFPDLYTCASTTDTSPPLAWTGGPAETQSWAIVFTDRDNALIHWAIWDIPAGVRALPEGVPNVRDLDGELAGARQARSFDGSTYGFLGPCPGEEHTYEFVLYAVDAAMLPDLGPDPSREAVEAAILGGGHSLASASLSGTWSP